MIKNLHPLTVERCIDFCTELCYTFSALAISEEMPFCTNTRLYPSSNFGIRQSFPHGWIEWKYFLRKIISVTPELRMSIGEGTFEAFYILKRSPSLGVGVQPFPEGLSIDGESQMGMRAKLLNCLNLYQLGESFK